MAKKLNILWIINILLPGASRALGLEERVIGGWLTAYRESLRQYAPQVSVSIVSPGPVAERRTLTVDGDRYDVFPEGSTARERQHIFRTILDEVRPDVVHIHGSESPHSLDLLEVSHPLRTVLSVQGLVSVCADHYYGGISWADRWRHTTLRDVWRHNLWCQGRHRFVVNGRKEQELIARVGNIIGRTEWDRAHCRALHPEARYFHCEEALRAEFYTPRWQRERCFDTPTLFVSQAAFPLKGLHCLLEALPLVLRLHPDLRLHIAGDSLIDAPRYKRTSYGQYLLHTAQRLGVADHLHYLGSLTAPQMVEQYLGARLFVSPSSIENSSNSVCEAQLLGTPVVASNVGGTADLVTHRATGMLYRFEETAMLADYINELLANDALCRRLSEAERATAQRRHDRASVAARLVDIYEAIAQAH